MTNLTKDLAEVVKACAYADGHAPLSDTELDLRLFIRTRHATIQQNAEAALRLRSLEQAMGECDRREMYIRQASIKWLNDRSNEILREWKEKGDE